MARLTIYFVLAFLFLFREQIRSQPNDIVVKYEIAKDQSVKFTYEKNVYGTYYLQVNFKYLENSIFAGFRGNIDGRSGTLFTLKPSDISRGIGFSYDYNWIRGKLQARVDTTFTYLLPLSKGKKALVFNQGYDYNHYFGAENPRNWKAFLFKVSEGDTVFSARKGVVVEVKDGFEPDSTLFYSNKSNSIMIEHQDGTLARYNVLKKGSIKVEPGQTVYAHTPIAIAGTYNLGTNSQVSFTVCYLIEDKLDNSGHKTMKTNKNYFSYIDPVFHTTDGDVCLKSNQTYTADLNKEIITKELSKSERKKMESTKLK